MTTKGKFGACLAVLCLMAMSLNAGAAHSGDLPSMKDILKKAKAEAKAMPSIPPDAGIVLPPPAGAVRQVTEQERQHLIELAYAIVRKDGDRAETTDHVNYKASIHVCRDAYKQSNDKWLATLKNSGRGGTMCANGAGFAYSVGFKRIDEQGTVLIKGLEFINLASLFFYAEQDRGTVVTDGPVAARFGIAPKNGKIICYVPNNFSEAAQTQLRAALEFWSGVQAGDIE